MEPKINGDGVRAS